MDDETLMFGENAAYLEDLQARALAAPASVDRTTARWAEATAGGRPAIPSLAPRSIFHPRAPSRMDTADLQAKVGRLIYAYRAQGHEVARIDPLGLRPAGPHQELALQHFGLTEADLDRVVATHPANGLPGHTTLRELVAHLEAVYCGTIGVEVMNIRDAALRRWVMERLETRLERPALDRKAQIDVLEMLTRAVGFEQYLGVKFMGYKRFSIEGAESLIPLLILTLDESARLGVKEVVLGMAHRGRLNVLLNVLHKPPERMLAEFAGMVGEGDGSGDVKYHLGYSSNHRTADGKDIHVSLCFNPSHLEAVDPVCLGRVRAKHDRYGDTTRRRALGLLVHGDAAFAGQGIVAETLNLSGLRGYRTGGTVHVVVNNQIGFTTSPTESRSTPYATDVARMLGIPIFHVNGEDPESVAQVVKIASAWRNEFGQDVVIDLYCYRRHGHNETDEPAFTQPIMYRKIAEHPGVREVWLRDLIRRGVLTADEGAAMLGRFAASLDEALSGVNAGKGQGEPSQMQGVWSRYHSRTPDAVDTAVPAARLAELLLGLNRVPPDFRVHTKLLRLFKLHQEQAEGKRPLDWAAAELLAFASLVVQGHRVRLSGQDCGRGTFSHRHATYTDQVTGADYTPLQHLDAEQAPFDVYNSLLSEAAVLGFEYGYTLDLPEALVLWEAQFGDFANGAQVIIDNFLVSGESKWNRLTGLTLLLPHGYEGQGPEHSSARIERFLQMCAEGNMQVVNCTTPAQYFHLLRRQAIRNVRDPLIVFTPKSLLRHPEVVSPLSALAEGSFQELIGDGERRRRVVLCSGKVYYDLLVARGARDVALFRVEQIFPFPLKALREELLRHPGAELWWCQEEPKNMGGYSFVALLLLEEGISLRYSGRAASASPATGYPARHAAEQTALVELALGAEKTPGA